MPDTEIHHPAFSPDGQWVVFTRRGHEVDAAEATSLGTELEKRVEEEGRRIKNDREYAEPWIVLSHIAGSERIFIDRGWCPAFSPDGSQIAYERQVRPLTSRRVLAETTSGNEIAVYDRTTHTTRTLAVPASGQYGCPRFSPDGSLLLFAVEDAVNGAFSGTVGLASFSTRSREVKILLDPHTLRWMETDIRDWGFIGSDPAAILGNSASGQYTCRLRTLARDPRVVYSWPPAADDQPTVSFAQTDTGEVMLFDERWHTSTEPAPSKLRQARLDACHHLSPNGEFVAIAPHLMNQTHALCTRAPVEVRIQRRVGGQEVVGWEFHGEVRWVAWSHDSRKIGLVVTHHPKPETHRFACDLFLFDEFVVFDLGKGDGKRARLAN